MRAFERGLNVLRPVVLRREHTKNSDGSVLIELGETKVLCNVNIQNGVPRWMKNKGVGWLTAEYGMIPGSTNTRVDRESVRGKQMGRTVEIQRFIGRALRSAINFKSIPDKTILVDCDVLQADGGTRTAAITGSMVALIDALNKLQRKGIIIKDPLISWVAAVSVGLLENNVLLDLDYTEDSRAETDLNIVMNKEKNLIEIQGAAESGSFTRSQLNKMIDLAEFGIAQLVYAQEKALLFDTNYKSLFGENIT